MSGVDITEYEFTDSRLEHDGDNLIVEYEEWSGHLGGYSTSGLYLDLNKKDVIALAKHFNLTVDDLNV